MKKRRTEQPKKTPSIDKNWQVKCENCDQVPTVGTSKLCGPCYFGEGDTADGNW
jgi:hypothetical protein